MGKVYAIYVGKVNNTLVDTWAECKAQVDGVRGARYKSFKTRAEAERWLSDQHHSAFANRVRVGSAGQRTEKEAHTARRATRELLASLDPNGLLAFTDGCAKPSNPGFGGSGALLQVRTDSGVWTTVSEKQRSLGSHVTNNVAELEAVGLALDLVHEHDPEAKCMLTLLTDSDYTVGIFDSSSGYKPRKNLELIQRLRDRIQASGRTVQFRHTAGHVGLMQNERVDELARLGAESNPGFAPPRRKQKRRRDEKSSVKGQNEPEEGHKASARGEGKTRKEKKRQTKPTHSPSFQ